MNDKIIKAVEAVMNGAESYEIEGCFSKDSVAVSVSLHTPYKKYLDDVIYHIQLQAEQPKQKFICYDGEDFLEYEKELKEKYPDYEIITGKWGSPNPGRNAAIEKCNSDWIIFVDGDDFIDRRYIKSIKNKSEIIDDRTAIIYNDLLFSDGHSFAVPKKFDYWTLRLFNYVSAASAWRVKVLKNCGGFEDTRCYDDWTLATKLTALGYKAEKGNIPIRTRAHAGHRMDNIKTGMAIDFKWNHRTYGIVTLLAGRDDCFEPWLDWLMNADLPRQTGLYIVDNSENKFFQTKTWNALKMLYETKRFTHIDYRQYHGKPDLEKSEFERHMFVPNLYNSVIPYIREDFILTLEDDVEPPLDGFRQLVESFTAGHRIGAVTGVYGSRTGNNRIVAAWGNVKSGKDKDNYWHDILTYDDIEGKNILSVGFVAGGFTLWANALVKSCVPFRYNLYDDIYPSGWDSNLSRDIRKRKYELFLNCNVKCKHNFS